MTDWTEHLTEEERKRYRDHHDIQYLDGHCIAGCPGAWPCDAARAYRTVAALRALVKEKDEALDKLYAETENVPVPLANWFDAVIRAALALTEDTMRKRLEAK